MESESESQAVKEFFNREIDDIEGSVCPTEQGLTGHAQCEVLPGVRGIAERGNVITQWWGQAANYSQPGMERLDQKRWKRLR